MEGEFPVADSLIVLREESDGGAVLLHRESGASVAINPVGVEVWKRLDNAHSLCIERWKTRDPGVFLNKWTFWVKRENTWRVERLLWGDAGD